MAERQYHTAEKALNQLLDEGQHDHHLMHALARCQLALEQHEEALTTYHHVLHHADEADASHVAEAALVLDKPKEALPLFEQATQQPHHHEVLFLLAATEYKLGFIQQTRKHLNDAIRAGLEWDDDDMHDVVMQQALPIREFHDFEQLYLDAVEFVQKDNNNPQNRWFSINMPIFEIFSATAPGRQKKRAADLARLLSPHFDELFLSNGRSELWRILDDLANSEVDAAFGLEARQALKAENYAKIARLVLAVELEHLKQFAPSFGLSENLIKQTDLQQLIPLLPLRLAVSLMFLYSTSNPDDKLPNYQNKLDDNILAALVAACFISFYQQIEHFRSTVRDPKDL